MSPVGIDENSKDDSCVVPAVTFFWFVILLIWVHFFADFVAQNDWMATNKSKNWKALVVHACVYAVFFIPFGFLLSILTGLLHAMVDATTSRITSHLWSKGERHWFFVVIGADQAIHLTVLMVTYLLL